MDTPGNLLRSEREKQSKSLEDIAKALKINIEYLRAIEKDNYGLLPADVFIKSYLRSYSGVLGLKGDSILALYNKQFGPPAKEPAPQKKRLQEMLPAFKLNYIYLLTICIGLAIGSITAYMKHDIKEAPAVITNAVPVVETESTETMTADIEEAVAEAVVTKEALSLEIAAAELTWVSIKIDSTDPEELLLRAGERKTITAHEKFVLKIGNAGGTSLILNGRDIGNLGPHGQLVDITLP